MGTNHQAPKAIAALMLMKSRHSQMAESEETRKHGSTTPLSSSGYASSAYFEISPTKMEAVEALLILAVGPEEAKCLLDKWNSDTMKDVNTEHSGDESADDPDKTLTDSDGCSEDYNSENEWPLPKNPNQREYLSNNKRRLFTDVTSQSEVTMMEDDQRVPLW